MPGCRVRSPPPRQPGHPPGSPGHRTVCRAARRRDRRADPLAGCRRARPDPRPGHRPPGPGGAAAVSHPLARRQAVSVEDLAGQPVARPPAAFPPALWEALVPANTPSGKPIPQTHEARSLHEIWALAARGLLVHPTVASTAQLLRRDDIVLVPITDLPPIRLGLIWRSACHSARIQAAVQRFKSDIHGGEAADLAEELD